MSTTSGARVPGMAVVAAALTALCAGMLAPARPALAATFVPIDGAGSTWAYPAIRSWIVSVGQTGMTVNYAVSGSTSGRNLFKSGVSDWAASEIPYGVQDGSSFDPPPTRGYAYIPDVAGGLAFTYNLRINGQRVTNLRLSGAVIAGIFTNQITMWNDPRIAADNPGLTLPATPVIPVVRSDGDGSTWQLTQWMLATQGSYWRAYCAVTGRSPCTPTSTYPVQPGTAMVAQVGDTAVATYVAQAQAEGAIGYTQYSWVLQTGFPVAKVLNAAGYYTLPTPGHVGVSLLNAQINSDSSSPLYLTADLSQVYADPDPRTYELSSYSYMIIPTDLTNNMTTDKGYTLGTFGQYLLCQGQSQVDTLGYSALPINLVEAGFAQLQRIPGNQVPTTTSAFIASCHNPTFSTDGTNTLAANDPMPPACDQQGATQCTTIGVANTVTTLAATPNPATAFQPVSLTATVTSTIGTAPPAGLVQFEAGGTAIGPPVALNSFGAAATTTMFAAAGTQTLTAVFTPTDATAYNTSTGTLSLTVQAAPPISATIPLAATAPVTGAFTLTVDTTDTVTLTANGNTATAATTPIVVSDTRNTFPGWSVTGQDGNWTGSGTAQGASIAGDQLGWTPTSSTTPLTQGVALGSAIAPASPGLGSTPAVLASVFAGLGNGFGTTTLGANLNLLIPALQAAGDYTSGLTITAVSTNP